MVQIIPRQQSISGRIGKGFGQGLAEQIPKEIDRYRLSSGLKKLGEKKNLDPFEAFSELSSIPGITPQMVESGSRLLAQRSRGNAFKDGESGKPNNPFKQDKSNIVSEEKGKEAPSVTTRTPVEATLKPYIPQTEMQLQSRAGELLDQNPQAYNNDPQLALDAARREDAQQQSINATLQGQRSNEQNVQNNVTEGLREQQKNLGALIPGNVYSDIEDKAINAVKSVSEGGEGITEQQAKKKYGKELDDIARQYKAVSTIGNKDFLLRDKNAIKNELNTIRKEFKKRNDLENFADTMINEQHISPSKAYYSAFHVSDNKELNNAIVKLPEINRSQIMRESDLPSFDEVEKRIGDRTIKIAEKLASKMTKEDSPLAISEELRSKGYDPDVWLNYLRKNRDELGLSERQGRELQKPKPVMPTLNDNLLFYMQGLDKLVEQ